MRPDNMSPQDPNANMNNINHQSTSIVRPKQSTTVVITPYESISNVDENSNNKKSSKARYFFNKTRFLILVLSLACLTVTQANTLGLNFTVICMGGNSTSLHWIEDSSKVSLLFSAIAIGSIIGTFPIMPAITKFGVRKTFVAYGLISAFSTILLPFAATLGFIAVFICRIMQGLAQAVLFSIVGAISERWSPIKEAGTFISILSGCLQLGSIITMPVAALACESSMTWRLLYYLQGGVTLVLFVLFFLFYRDDPEIHRKVSTKELSRIQLNKPPVTKKQTPYLAICKDKTILGVWLSTAGSSLAFLTLLLYGPVYMNKALNLDVKSTGFATALPYILSLIFKFVAGPISDYSSCISERARILLFAVLSQSMVAASFLIMAITSSALLASIFYTATIVFSGVNVIGVIKCAQLRARQYCAFVMMIISFLMCVLNLLLPIAVAWVCPNNEIHEWSRLFIGVAILVIVCNIPFIFVASSESATYTNAEQTISSKRKVVPAPYANNAFVHDSGFSPTAINANEDKSTQTTILRSSSSIF